MRIITLVCVAVCLACCGCTDSAHEAKARATNPPVVRESERSVVFRVVVVDSCEYIATFSNSGASGRTDVDLIHKANCNNPIHGGSK